MAPPFEKILIIGAGPSGLLLAILLAQAQIPTLVLEAWPGLDTRLRAVQYGTPATRIFRRAGLLPDFRAASIPKFPEICWRRVADGEKLVEIDMSVVEDDEDRMTVLQLSEIVQIMYRHCVEKWSEWIDVRFNHRVVGAGNAEDGKVAWVDVEIGAEAEGKRLERVEAEYIVGCDGASSAIRRALYGRGWPGQTFPCKLVVQNIFYDGFEKHGWDGGNYMVDPEHWGLIARRGHGGLWKVTYGDNAVGLTDEEYLERRDWHLKNMLPGNPEPDEYRVEQTNLYLMHNRCVPDFRVGRILLAGDAAHVCNPWGGYGCMTACLDVGGLADCFIGHYLGLADSSILDTYASVRRDIFLTYVDRRSIKNLDRIWKADPWTVGDTDPFFAMLRDLGKDREKLRRFLLKWSSVEYDFIKHWSSVPEEWKGVNGVDGGKGKVS